MAGFDILGNILHIFLAKKSSVMQFISGTPVTVSVTGLTPNRVTENGQTILSNIYLTEISYMTYFAGFLPPSIRKDPSYMVLFTAPNKTFSLEQS